MDKIYLNNAEYSFMADWFKERFPKPPMRVPIVFKQFEILFTAEEERAFVDKFSCNVKLIPEKRAFYIAVEVHPKTKEKINPFRFHYYMNIGEKNNEDMLYIMNTYVRGQPLSSIDKKFLGEEAEGYDKWSFGVDLYSDATYPEDIWVATRVISSMIVVLFAFFSDFEQELVEYAEKNIEHTTKKKKNGKKKNGSKKTVVTHTIRLNKYIRDIKSGKKILPKIRKKCDYAFDVRGHYRHYKSGKVVWVKPYVKNTESKGTGKDRHFKFDFSSKSKDKSL